MLEVHNDAMKNPSVHRYNWYIYTNFPFPAHLYLLCALRYRTRGELSERAWQLLSESAEARAKHNENHLLANKKDKFMNNAVANMAVKAWEAREIALQNLPRTRQMPHFVSEYQKQLAENNCKGSSMTNEPVSNTQTDLSVGNFEAQFPILSPNSVTVGRDFDQSMLPGMLPTDIPPPNWDFWNDILQGGDSVQWGDPISPQYNYHQN